MSSCVFIPNALNKEGAPASNLYKRLNNFYKDRNIANEVWATATVLADALKNVDGIEFDENGEITFDSLSSVVPLNTIAANNLEIEKKEANAISEDGVPIKYSTVEKALEEIQKHKKEADDNGISLFPVPSSNYPGATEIAVEEKTPANSANYDNAVFHNSLNNYLLQILNSIGLTALTKKDIRSHLGTAVHGIFDPYNATITADNLKAVISILKGELGENQFPEEVCHALIRGLRNHPLVQRLIQNILKDNIEKDILQEEYEENRALYDDAHLAEEVAGRLLLEEIKKQFKRKEYGYIRKLLSRIWDYAKGLLGKINQSDLDKAIARAKNDAYGVANIVTSNSLNEVFDANYYLIDPTPMYHSAVAAVSNGLQYTSKLEELANKMADLFTTQLAIERSRTGSYKIPTKNTSKELNSAVETHRFMAACGTYLSSVFTESKQLLDSINMREKAMRASTSTERNILNAGAEMTELQSMIERHASIVNQLLNIEKIVPAGTSPDVVKMVKESAEKVSSTLSTMQGALENMQLYLTIQLVAPMSSEIFTEDMTEEERMHALEMLYTRPNKDIGTIAKWLYGMSEVNDPGITMIGKYLNYKRQQRDSLIRGSLSKIRILHHNLRKAGIYNTDFMYEKDENGIPTGRIISKYDFDKYSEDRKAYYEMVDNNKLLSKANKYALKEQWDRENSQEVKIYYSNNEYITQRVPKGEKPGDPYYKGPLPFEDDTAKMEYYNEMLKMKAFCESMAQDGRQDVYKAVQLRANLIEEIGRAKKQGPRQVLRALKSNIGSLFQRVEDDTEFGEDTTGVLTNYDGTFFKKVPVYYRRLLKDPARMSTDFTGSLIAYLATTANYLIFNDIADTMEVTREVMRRRQPANRKYDEDINATQRALGRVVRNIARKKAGESNSFWMYSRKLDHLLYDRAKMYEGGKSFSLLTPTSWNILKKKNWEKRKYRIDASKVVDTVKTYGSQKGLGFNIFSGGVNLLTGKVQEITEAAGGQFFGLKDLMYAHKLYYTNLGDYILEWGSTKKTSLMGLMEERFDTTHDFTHTLRAQGQYKGVVARLMNRGTPLFFNTMGEHLLHNQTMFAILHHIEATVNGKKDRLVNAFTVRENEQGGADLVFKTGTKDSDGNELFSEALAEEFDNLAVKEENQGLTAAENARQKELIDIYNYTESLLTDLQLKIRRINSELHGGFDEWDKGIIHQYALGRLIMHFRQWMPAYFKRRFSERRKDPILGEREGFYRTAGRYLIGEFVKSMLDDYDNVFKAYIFQYKSKDFSDLERSNLRKFLCEMGIAMTLIIGNFITDGDEEDENLNWGAKYALLMMRRLENDVTLQINPVAMWNIIQSPVPSESIISDARYLWEASKWGEEIQRGKYKGMTKFEAGAIRFLPYTKNIYNMYTFAEDNNLFKFQ